MKKIVVKGLIMACMTMSAQAGQVPSALNQTRLEIVQMGNPVLREPARALSKEEILSPQIQQLIEMMKVTMSGIGVGLAAPQIGCPFQIAVIEDREEYHKALSPEILKERERAPVAFHVIINPKMTLDESETVEFFEACLSVNDCFGVVPRARSVRVECLNEKAEPVVIEAKGWYARILQHEIDHLFGTLFLDRALTKSFTTKENFEKYWRNRPMAEIRQAIRSN